MTQKLVDNPVACQAFCQTNDSCIAFSYNMNNGSCFQITSGPLVPKIGKDWISGPANCPAPKISSNMKGNLRDCSIISMPASQPRTNLRSQSGRRNFSIGPLIGDIRSSTAVLVA